MNRVTLPLEIGAFIPYIDIADCVAFKSTDCGVEWQIPGSANSCK